MNAKLFCLGLLLAMALTLRVGAEEISIFNHSFEDPVVADGVYDRSHLIPGWTAGLSPGWGVVNLMDIDFPGTSEGSPEPNPIDGFNAAYINTANKLMYEDANIVVQPNETYTVTLLVGNRIGVPFGTPSVSLWAGESLLAAVFPNPPPDGSFATVTNSYTAPASGGMIGEILRIELLVEGLNAQAFFDDVRLFTGVYPGDNYGCPRRATAVAEVVNGLVVGATITDNGCGYTNTPQVTITGGGGNGATAIAIMEEGRVIDMVVTSAGSHYTNGLPQIIIEAPSFLPTVTIGVSRIKVMMRVLPGETYLLESTTDFITWSPTGPAFTANTEVVVQEFDVEQPERFFRVRVAP